jgi:hypothetical protein
LNQMLAHQWRPKQVRDGTPRAKARMIGHSN